MPPKLWRNNHTERRGVFNIDGGVRMVTVWMRSDLYEKMHTCDSCGREGIIFAGHAEVVLKWTGRKLLCWMCL